MNYRDEIRNARLLSAAAMALCVTLMLNGHQWIGAAFAFISGCFLASIDDYKTLSVLNDAAQLNEKLHHQLIEMEKQQDARTHKM